MEVQGSAPMAYRNYDEMLAHTPEEGVALAEAEAEAEEESKFNRQERTIRTLPSVPLTSSSSATGARFPTTPGGIVADQGARVCDGIHILMNASCPLAVTAAAG